MNENRKRIWRILTYHKLSKYRQGKKMESIDFDNENEVKAKAHNNVSIKVGELAMLLNFFYMGGGEPDSLNDRWKLVNKQYKDYI